ncbi:MAG: hypothetical protein PUG66_08160 [Clostridiales bacterium]|nr:hypothetical protein [Eubacterium sp.]MDD7349795.1 hypothetical protein [Clostridiales bacterium]
MRREHKKELIRYVICFAIYVYLVAKWMTCDIDFNHVNEAEEYMEMYYTERTDGQNAREDLEKRCLDIQTVP